MFLPDTNIFLEILLDREYSFVIRDLLNRNPPTPFVPQPVGQLPVIVMQNTGRYNCTTRGLWSYTIRGFMIRQQPVKEKSTEVGIQFSNDASTEMPESMDFPALVRRIADIHHHLVEHATKAVNVSLTVRNWLIGHSLHEYELRGKDRATYGDQLFSTLVGNLTSHGVSNCSRRQLYRYRDFYVAYPHIVGTLFPQLQKLV